MLLNLNFRWPHSPESGNRYKKDHALVSVATVLKLSLVCEWGKSEVVDVTIDFTCLKKFTMSAYSCDLMFVQHNDLICISQRRKPV